MSIHTKIKNVVHQYTDAEKDVREATRRKLGFPDFTLMQKIAERTKNTKELREIMHMLHQRLKDRKKPNHVHKSLILLDHLLKYGSEDVATMFHRNLINIDELMEYQMDANLKGHELLILNKARDVSRLINDKALLREEREKAKKRLIPREPPLSGEHMQRFRYPVQLSSASDPHLQRRFSPTLWKPPSARQGDQSFTDSDSFRPWNLGEEELQLQLALAISKEEHCKEESLRRDDEAKLQMAIKESRKESEVANRMKVNASNNSVSNNSASNNSATINLDGLGLYEQVDTSLSVAPANQPDPWAAASATSAVPAATSSRIPIDDPWSSPVYSTPGATGFTPPSTSNSAWPGDPWSLQSSLGPPLFDISNNTNTNNNNSAKQSIFGAQGDRDAPPQWQPNWSASTPNATGGSSAAFDPKDAGGSSVANQEGVSDAPKATGEPERRRTPADFLGEHKNLVDVDRLIVVNPISTNPFVTSSRNLDRGAPSNPFLPPPNSKPSLNELAPNRAFGPQLALPAPSTFPAFPKQQGQLLPMLNSVSGVPGAGVGFVATTTPWMPVPAGQYALATTTTSPKAVVNPGSNDPNAFTLNPFY